MLNSSILGFSDGSIGGLGKGINLYAKNIINTLAVSPSIVSAIIFLIIFGLTIMPYSAIDIVAIAIA